MVLSLVSKFGSCEIDIQNSNQDFWIYYSKGSAWSGFHYEAEINSKNKFIVFESNKLPSYSERKMEYIIDAKEIDSLLFALQAVSSIELGSYESEAIKAYDFPTVTLKYKLNGHMDSTTICRPVKDEVPIQLESLLELVNRIKVKYDIKK
jgi:hypothetical protein